MSIKTLLEKAMLKIGARSGSPSSTDVTYPVTWKDDETATTSFVAPADGFCKFYGVSKGESCYGSIWSKADVMFCQPHAGNGITGSTRVAKGSNVSVSCNKMNKNYDVTVTFVYAIGGNG